MYAGNVLCIFLYFVHEDNHEERYDEEKNHHEENYDEEKNHHEENHVSRLVLIVFPAWSGETDTVNNK